MLADFLAALELADVTLVANDTGARSRRRRSATVRNAWAGSC